MRLAVIFEALRPGTTGTYIERAARQEGLAVDFWPLSAAARIPGGYDLYLRVDHGDAYTETLPSALRPSAFYAIDTHLPKSWRKIQRLAPSFDLVFCAQAGAAARLTNGSWLPLACDEELHAAQPHTDTLDIVFVGTEGGLPRKFYLQALRERYPRSSVGYADPSRLGELYGQARIGFNYSIADDVNMRIFEILAAGSLLVTNTLRDDSLERLGLRDHEHLVLFDQPQHMLKHIDYYLAHEEERRRIAHAGQALVRRAHTYRHRIRTLLGVIEERLGVAGHQTMEVAGCASA